MYKQQSSHHFNKTNKSLNLKVNPNTWLAFLYMVQSTSKFNIKFLNNFRKQLFAKFAQLA
jgi:hypothetical protein